MYLTRVKNVKAKSFGKNSEFSHFLVLMVRFLSELEDFCFKFYLNPLSGAVEAS